MKVNEKEQKMLQEWKQLSEELHRDISREKKIANFINGLIQLEKLSDSFSISPSYTVSESILSEDNEFGLYCTNEFYNLESILTFFKMLCIEVTYRNVSIGIYNTVNEAKEDLARNHIRTLSKIDRILISDTSSSDKFIVSEDEMKLINKNNSKLSLSIIGATLGVRFFIRHLPKRLAYRSPNLKSKLYHAFVAPLGIIKEYILDCLMNDEIDTKRRIINELLNPDNGILLGVKDESFVDMIKTLKSENITQRILREEVEKRKSF